MKRTKPTKPSEDYARFEQLARQVIAVPKSELDKREAAYDRKKIAEKKRKAALPVIVAPGQLTFDTMEPSAALSTSAQIAVAIAGFAGVVVAVRNESVHNWGRVEKFWLRLLLLNSILPLAFSLVGLLFLAIKPVPSPATWRWCSGFAALSLLPYATMIFTSLLRFAPGQLKAAGGGRFTSYTLFALLTAVCLLQLYNVATLAAFWPYFGAIVSLLLGAMYQFVRLILIPQQSGT